MSEIEKTFDKRFRQIFIPFLGFIFLILSFPYLFTSNSFFDINFSETGNIGDTIGGILGPFIAIAAAILTFFAFWVQYKANEQQKLDLKIERFENKFYELLKLHKENVNELDLGNNLKGRKTFVHLTNELRVCYKVCENVIPQDENFSDINLIKFSYDIFYYGIGKLSEKYLFNRFNKNEKKLYNIVVKHLDLFQNQYNDLIKNPSLQDKNYKYKENITMNLLYAPFNGHVSKLGHYFRHLFHIAKFVINQNSDLLNENQKYDYIRTLRAQLSDHEQLLMYYNAIAWFEDDWRELFTTYRLIKNIPIPLADFDKSPLEFYSEEIEQNENKKIFSWQ